MLRLLRITTVAARKAFGFRSIALLGRLAIGAQRQPAIRPSWKELLRSGCDSPPIGKPVLPKCWAATSINRGPREKRHRRVGPAAAAQRAVIPA